MTGIINLQRDAKFVDLEKTRIAWSNVSSITGDILANADATVYDAYSSAHNNMAAAVIASAANTQVFGLYLYPPIELSPYRVKAYAGSDDSANTFHLVIGHSGAAIDGGNDTITNVQYYPFTGKLDELFMIEPETSDGTEPIFFGIAIRGITTGAICDAGISAQRLATSPPVFSQSVS